MNNHRKLLVVDDDFGEYDTPEALTIAIGRLKSEALNWSYEVCKQSQAMEKWTSQRFNAVLIDNDFGDGVPTLSEAIKTKIPIGYVSAYDLEGLSLQSQYVPEARGIEFRVFLEVTLIQKGGHNIAKDVTKEMLEDRIYHFLKARH